MAEIHRDIYSKLDAWKDSTSRHPLLVRGTRQVGKSHAIRTWAKKNFENFLEINLEEQSSLRSVFQKDLTADQLLQNLELGTGVNLFGKNSVSRAFDCTLQNSVVKKPLCYRNGILSGLKKRLFCHSTWLLG